MENCKLEWEVTSQEVKDRLYNEFGMTKDSVKQDIEHLKTWVNKQPHLPHVADDELLETFLFSCKNSLETAKTKLDQYYTVRATMPEYFLERDPTNPQLQKHMLYTPLPRLTKEGYRVIFVKFYDTDPSNFDPLTTNKGALMLCEVLFRWEKCAGILVIYDTEGLTLAHTGAVTIRMTKNFIQCALSAFPQRVKGIHLINTSPVAQAFLNFNKMFLKDKIKNRIFMHTKESSTLFDHVSKEIIPQEYGGTFPCTMTQVREFTIKNLENYKNLFLKEKDIMADLTKKAANGETSALEEAELFGIQGSFRSIHID
ncbi:alpha-tocopherol transfer protein-like [Lycorma delicatula]|uniref:alpha-tocopherol transfer protein-like n=1 Tax=Lycorma delicatula TaxID=130591 RepID=UPI003F510B7F